ncbi:hypothetical protein B0I72DRAFT_139589 [Yarrowia lipolytica]|jgi:hypothetical protein|uniref:Noranthrone monooxygenase n=1 Tax=Yarrowia lipolytica TaxID=4952 RepID=A0A371C422_YARLL|nr:Hypothetical protein YALI2_C00712g [Yarrowia lipolytica]RDW24730.1 hypothetical protein B0I71DRAFT_121118 [Yarrowia lipolytica]RDW31572.1 hypothetical protein B0I72DRAFT_139589 [Yarrowia lipolytica]RDW39126.1 hypothetical protein B0I73DRAFT_169543 [Yarrowia lipolytica]RDW45705.1 hypothetical protein B0I74DRAFT_138293 [Yarrowia lipolytica]
MPEKSTTTSEIRSEISSASKDISSNAPIALKASGVFFSGLAAGGTLITTLYLRPIFSQMTTNAAYTVFDFVYGVGKVAFPLFAGLGAASFGGAAYIESQRTRKDVTPRKWYNPSSSTLLAYSAASLVAIVPYTLIVMKPCLTMLFDRRGEVVKGEDIMDLLNLWATHHLARVVLTSAGFLGGIVSLLK